MPKKTQNFGNVAKDLSRNPLGIIALFLVLVYSVASLVVAFGRALNYEEKIPIIYFMVLFPVLVLVVFAWLVSKHHLKLFAPSDFKDEDNYVKMQQARQEPPPGIPVIVSPREPPGLIVPPQPDDAPLAEEDGKPEADDSLWMRPTPSWTRRQYEIAYFFCTIEKKIDQSREISEQYLNTESASDGDNTSTWRAYCVLTRIRHTNAGGIETLISLSQGHPHNSLIHERLAEAYEYYQNYELAATSYQNASSVAESNADKQRLLKSAARSHINGGKFALAASIVEKMKEIVLKTGDGEQNVLETVVLMAEKDGDHQAAIAALERLLEKNPGNAELCFSVAYKHAEAGNHDLALFHYLAIPERQRQSAAWNNLAVVFEHFKLRARAVTAYRAAKELGETLAMANLAYTFASAGFLEEAREECNIAMRHDNCHKNVASALVRIQDIPEEESKKLEKLLENVEDRRDFYKMAGQGEVQTIGRNLEGVWKSDICDLEIRIEGTEFKATGMYEVPQGGILSALAAYGQASTERKHIEYKGKLFGKTIVGRVARKSADDSNTFSDILGGFADEKAFLMVLSADENEIHAMEGGSDSRFYSLVRRPLLLSDVGGEGKR